MKEKYSGKEIIKAGETLIGYGDLSDVDFNEAMSALSYWRFGHEQSLESALVILKDSVIREDKSAIFAKRLKRYVSIVSKLRRFPKMKLKNMQDIGGCRAIVSNQKKLYKIVRTLKGRSEFRKSNNLIRYKDYIKSPKEDGYRGYHIIGSFVGRNNEKKFIEIQIRTLMQHDWATALEIVDLFTGQALKSNHGQHDWKRFFSLVSQHFSLMEEVHLFREKPRDEQFSLYSKKVTLNPNYLETGLEIQELEASLRVIRNLEAFAHSLKTADEHIAEKQVNGYVLLSIDTSKKTVLSMLFNDNQNEEAERMYLQYEKDAKGSKDNVIALVSTTAVGGIKEAYPNFFADSTEFLSYLLHIINFQSSSRPNLIQRMLLKSGL